METDSRNIEFRDWLILDSLSDDYESVEQIIQCVRNDWPAAPALEIIDRLEHLYSEGLVFLTLQANFNRAEMIREIDQTHARGFWFGRTPGGNTLWQQRATDFGHT